LWIKSARPSSHAQSRTKAILSQAAQRDYPVIVIGDSIVELAAIHSLCGKLTLNAGIAGMPVEKIDGVAKLLLSGRRPKLVVIAAGVNNAHFGDPADAPEFVPAYHDIIRLAQAGGAHVVAMNIAPVADASFESARLFDVGRIRRLNRKIAHMGVPVIDLWSAMAKGQVLKPGFTNDGVHPSPLGYRAWNMALEQACSAGDF
jgi:lysophospholipase L1-like esterase